MYCRYATEQSRPPVDSQQDIANVSVTVEEGVTTIEFARERDTGDADRDFTLDQCRYFLWAFNGGVGDYADPTSITRHDFRGVFPNRYCIPDGCGECRLRHSFVVNVRVVTNLIVPEVEVQVGQ